MVILHVQLFSFKGEKVVPVQREFFSRTQKRICYPVSEGAFFRTILYIYIQARLHSEIHDEVHEALMMVEYYPSILQKDQLGRDDLVELQLMLFSLRGSSLQSLSLEDLGQLLNVR